MATVTGIGAGVKSARRKPRLALNCLSLDYDEGVRCLISKKTECKKSVSLPDLMKKGFHDPDIVKSIVPSIMQNIMHTIHSQITEAIDITLKTSQLLQ